MPRFPFPTARLLAAPILLSGGIAMADATTRPTTQPTPTAAATQPATRGTVPGDAKDTKPLEAGAIAPAVAVKDAAGEEVVVSGLAGEHGAVLVFYRGGWCPYCTTQLADLARIQPRLAERGIPIIGISPDSPARIASYLEEESTPLRLLSDSSHAASRAFGLAFRVDDETHRMLLGHGMDIVEASGGNPARILPVPSVFVLDPDGRIAFAHANPDYRERLDGDALLEAVDAYLEP